MNEVISLCGMNCGICPAYKTNLVSDEDRIKVDEGWKKFHRTRGWTYKQSYCEGCFNIPENPPLWANCYIRKCVLNNKVENCGFCFDYPCPRVKNINHATNAIAKRTRKTGTEEEFEKFALPYLNEPRLQEIHQNFIQTVQDGTFEPINVNTVSFPSTLNSEALSGTHLELKNATEALQNLHNILESIMTLHCKTPGGQEQELKRNKDLVKFFWIIGRFGTILTDNNEILIEITLEEIKKHLRYGKHKTKSKLQELTAHGIEGGYLENKIQIKFTEKSDTAIILQNYIKILLEDNSERTAYSKFWKADMNLFSK
ncbi:MAG: DUF3795 domain-containing protein [Candidatus Hodarchaeota archaeon]